MKLLSALAIALLFSTANQVAAEPREPQSSFMNFGNGSAGNTQPFCPTNNDSMGSTLSREVTGEAICKKTYRVLEDEVRKANPDAWFQWGQRTLSVDGYFETWHAAQQGVSTYRVMRDCVAGRRVVYHQLPVEYVHRVHHQYWYCFGNSCSPMGTKDSDWKAGFAPPATHD